MVGLSRSAVSKKKQQPNSAPEKAGAPETQRGVTESFATAMQPGDQKICINPCNSSLTKYYRFGKRDTIPVLGIPLIPTSSLTHAIPPPKKMGGSRSHHPSKSQKRQAAVIT
jgi:hypothetical protein